MSRGSEIKTEEITKIIKEKIINHLLEKHNILWLNDEIEREIYNIIFELMDQYIISNYWGLE